MSLSSSSLFVVVLLVLVLLVLLLLLVLVITCMHVLMTGLLPAAWWQSLRGRTCLATWSAPSRPTLPGLLQQPWISLHTSLLRKKRHRLTQYRQRWLPFTEVSTHECVLL